MTKGERRHINIYLDGYIMEDVRHIKICPLCNMENEKDNALKYI